jgi:mono/diheme cytochrome c family protein
MSRFSPILSVLVLAPLLAVVTVAASTSHADDNEKFFEQKVRPLLIQRCIECHGEKKQEGDVRLDSGVAIAKKVSSGPLAAPGNPGGSRIMQVIAWKDDDTQMPPKAKLPDEEIAILKTWIEQGAHWPANDPANSKATGGLPRNADGTIDFAKAAEQHWAYRQVESRPLPRVQHPEKAEGAIDRLILSKLEEQGLTLSPEADRATLIRRLSFDLHGLPPSAEEVEQFVNDPSPDAYAKLVDRLLDSPKYGERWGRHWLDIARYGDTKGYVFTQERRYPYAYTYRDYVIEALNSDKPYDRFILEQLAADQLGLAANDPALAGLGFLTVGRRYLNNEQDIIDDRIDVVTRGLMGTTVACARCHDHKYDPTLAADYYGLYGVFASSHEPQDLPLIGEPIETPEYLEFKKEQEKRQAEIEKYSAEQHVELTKRAREQIADYFVAVVIKQGKQPGGFEPKYQFGPPREKITERWKGYLDRRIEQGDTVFAAWKALNGLKPEEFVAKAPEVFGSLKGASPPADAVVVEALQAANVKSMIDVASVYAKLVNESREAWQKLKTENAAADKLPDASREMLRQVAFSPEAPPQISLEEAKRSLFERDQRDRLTELKRKVDELIVESRGAPARAMVMFDNDKPHEPVIFERGNPGRRGPQVPRQFLRILSRSDTKFQKGSGRLELAEDIASADNPLTTRVLANRLWIHHFGRGLVVTPGDWGTRSEKPTHIDLLDWMADRLVKSGWSLKALHRDILLSATYRQGSQDNDASRAKDPENRLVWRQNRRRLEFEAMRDSLLAVAGKLDPTMTGRPINIEDEPYSGRRSVYAFIDRNNFSALLRTFDFPTPDTSSSQRPETVVPQQALFELNSKFMRQMAESLAARCQAESGGSPEKLVELLYRGTLSRLPTPEEKKAAVEFINGVPERNKEVAQVLLMTNEFLFVD